MRFCSVFNLGLSNLYINQERHVRQGRHFRQGSNPRGLNFFDGQYLLRFKYWLFLKTVFLDLQTFMTLGVKSLNITVGWNLNQMFLNMPIFSRRVDRHKLSIPPGLQGIYWRYGRLGKKGGQIRQKKQS